MGILNIAPVTRTGMRLMISLYGLSETGKTLSGLKLAAGIEPDPTKRGLLDTEGGQRGRAYVDYIDGGYLYAQLTPPFTPERYIQALEEFEAAGVNVLVVDSISHAWFAEGGILDIVDSSSSNGQDKWNKPKRRLAKMTGRILHSDMHIILCSRGKQPLVEEADPNRPGKVKLVPGQVVPVQEKNLRYDMTIMAQMLGDGRFSIGKPEGKCPGPLREVFGSSDVMNEQMGRRLAEWVASQGGKSPEQRKLESDATAAAESGTDAFRDFWKQLTAEQRETLKLNVGNYQSIAKAADAEKARQEQEESERRNLGAPFGTAAGTSPATAPASTAAEPEPSDATANDPAGAGADDIPPDLTGPAAEAYVEALNAARLGIGALNNWWNGEGKRTALGTDTAKKILIGKYWNKLQEIANAVEL